MKKIAIIDSGSGGINVLAKCVEFCPCFNYLLYIDDKNLPYGEKTIEEIKQISYDTVSEIKEIFNPQIIILACNTLTAVAYDFLIKNFPNIKFIGTRPNLKCEKERLLILATRLTIENSPLLLDYQEYCFNPKGLPEVIDNNLFERENIISYLNNLPQGNYKNIVLGCTHFEKIKEELRLFYPQANFLDGSDKVIDELKRYCYGKAWQLQIICSREKHDIFYSYLTSLISSKRFL